MNAFLQIFMSYFISESLNIKLLQMDISNLGKCVLITCLQNKPVITKCIVIRFARHTRRRAGRNIFFRITVQYCTYQLSPATEF